MPLTDEAASGLEQWKIGRAATADGLLDSRLGTLNSIVLRLALILELLWWSATDAVPETVSVEALARAADFVDEYLKPMAQRVFDDAAIPEAD